MRCGESDRVNRESPIVGDIYPNRSSAPRSVTPEYFYEVCQERTIIGSYEVNNLLVDPTASTLIQAWSEKLASHRCVETEMSPPEIFNEQ